MSEDLEYENVITALQVRTNALLKIRKADTLEEASKIAGNALCIGPGRKAVLKEALRHEKEKR